jgi:hypothetical protein
MANQDYCKPTYARIASAARPVIHVWTELAAPELVGMELAWTNNRRRRRKKRAPASFHQGIRAK